MCDVTIANYCKQNGLKSFKTMIKMCMEEDSEREFNRVKFQLTNIYKTKPNLFKVILTGALMLQDDLPKRSKSIKR